MTDRDIYFGTSVGKICHPGKPRLTETSYDVLDSARLKLAILPDDYAPLCSRSGLATMINGAVKTPGRRRAYWRQIHAIQVHRGHLEYKRAVEFQMEYRLY